MFRNNKVSVLEWIILIIILNIPILNVIFAVVLTLRGRTSVTIKNFFVAYLVMWFFAVFGIFSGAFGNFQGLFG